MPESKPISKTDWKRVEAMTDADIVYDEDTGRPFDTDYLNGADGFVAGGLDDFQKKLKLAQEQQS